MALNNACRNFPVEQKAIEPEMLKVLAETEGACIGWSIQDDGLCLHHC